ncbi:MAG TPA: DUF3426 domain-containing protein [Geothermobacteraceae bacterium]|nr:DUF3426 domain-containing protein [Geothermobacteraceae bacterium]
MIIQCTDCQTRFKLADDKMKPAGVRVRCTNCNVVFTALPPEPEYTLAPAPAPAHKPSLGAEANPASGFSDTADFSDLNFDEEQPAKDQSPDKDLTGDQEFDFGEFNMEDLDDTAEGPSESAAASPIDQTAFELESSLDIPDFSREGEIPAVNNQINDIESDELPPLEDFNLDDEFTGFDDSEPALPVEPSPSFDPDDDLQIGGDLGATFEDESPDEVLPELDRSALGTHEFSFDDSPDEPLVDTESSEPAGPVEFSFDSDEDPFAIPEEKPAVQSAPDNTDEFVFEVAAADEIEAPPAKPLQPQEPRQAQAPPSTEVSRDKQPPPLQRRSKKLPTKRRKQRGGYRSVMFFLLFLVVAGAGYAYFGWQQGTYKPEILIERAKFLIKGSTTEEMAGQIDFSELRSQFVVNQSAGNLFVVHGKAINNFTGARSTISVRGIIYDAAGKVILQQTAFCGNPLDEAALRILPYAKIEETMNNQFGEALSNLNIDPGQAIPFTIVFRNIPAQVAEFNIELADSRPGAK